MTEASRNISVEILRVLSGDPIGNFVFTASSSINDVKLKLQDLDGLNKFRQQLFTTGSNVPLDDSVELKSLPQPLSLSFAALSYIAEDAAVGSDLVAAAKEGDCSRLRRLLHLPAQPDYSGSENNTPLIAAAMSGHSEAVKLLLEAGADKDKSIDVHGSFKGAFPLLVATELEVVQLLCEAGADKEKTGPMGYTALLMAAQNGSLEIAQYLCAAKADIERTRDGGRTPLSMAAGKGHLELVRFLCKAGANKDTPQKDGATPMYMATQRAHWDVVGFLCDEGADKDRPLTSTGDTPLCHAARYGLNFGEDKKQAMAGVKILCEAGADLEKANNDGCSPLGYAVVVHNCELVEYLCEKRANVNVQPRDKTTPLSVAVLKRHLQLVELLCQKRAQPDLASEEGATPLHYAARSGNLEIVKCLCAAGADTQRTMPDGRNPLAIATQEGKLEVVAFLSEKSSP